MIAPEHYINMLPRISHMSREIEYHSDVQAGIMDQSVRGLERHNQSSPTRLQQLWIPSLDRALPLCNRKIPQSLCHPSGRRIEQRG